MPTHLAISRVGVEAYVARGDTPGAGERVEARPFAVLESGERLVGLRPIPGLDFPRAPDVATSESLQDDHPPPGELRADQFRDAIDPIVNGLRRKARVLLWAPLVDALRERGDDRDVDDFENLPFSVEFR